MLKKRILISGCLVMVLIFIYVSSNITNTNNEQEVESEVGQEYRLLNNREKVDLIVLKLAHYFPESHPQHIALSQKFAPMVEEGSDWKIRVEVYPNNQLGEEQEYIQGVRNGTIEMCIGRQSLAEIFPKLKITEFPYMFDSYEQVELLLNGKLGNKITEGMDSLGVRSLSWSLNGFRQICTYEKSLISTGNGEKLKLATTFFKPNIETLKTMGFDVFPVSINQTTMVLKQNMVDGHDNPPLMSYYNGWYEKQKNIFITNHVTSLDMYIVSDKFWVTLSKEHQELLKAASTESASYEIELLRKAEKDIFNTLEEQGVKMEYPDLVPYKKAVQPYYLEWMNHDNKLKEIFDELISEKAKIMKNQ